MASPALAVAPRHARSRRPQRRVGPYPDLGGCPVFPDPPAGLAADAPSLPNEAAWNQDISKAPVAPNSAATIAYIDAHGGDRLHPDFGSPRAYGFPYAVVGAGQRELPIHYTAYGDESDPGPFPVPPGAPVEGGDGSDGDRHVLVVDRSSCTLYELYRAFSERRGGAHWNADSGARWDLRSTRAAARLLDLGRRRRAADLPRPGPLRRGRRRPRRPRDPGHLRQHPQRLGPPRLALRRRHLRPERAGDGHAAAAEGGLRRSAASAAAPGPSPKRSSATA